VNFIASSLIQIQDFLLLSSPAAYPLLGILLSWVSGVHCALMCSPFLTHLNAEDKNKYFLGRLLSYTLLGAIFGSIGGTLKARLEIQLVSLLAFLIFGALTIFIILLQIFPKWKTPQILQSSSHSSFVRGVLSASIPCHSLILMYSIAGLAASAQGGALLLFLHALMTMPALNWGANFYIKSNSKKQTIKNLLRWLVILLSIVNIAYFASRFFQSEESARAKILFCL
jgi:sulfite exporter TauE/SafE